MMQKSKTDLTDPEVRLFLWKNGISLDQAVLHFSTPEQQERYTVLRQEDNAVNREKAIFDRYLGKSIFDSLSPPTQASQNLKAHVQNIHDTIVRDGLAGRIVALGYPISRLPADPPQIIPDDLWSEQVDWNKSEIKGRDLHFVSVRLACQNMGECSDLKIEPQLSKTSKLIFPSDLKIEKPSLKDNIKARQKSPLKKRRNELHDCIGKVIGELEKRGNRSPSGADVWRALREKIGVDEFECLQSMEFDENKKEDAIYWHSMAGKQRKMLKSRFLNVVSEYNTGTKKLPDIG